MLISDVPDRPEGPVEISNITKDSVTLSWQPPTKDGGTPLTGYVIEQRDTRRTQWVKAGSVDKDTTTFVASKLLEDNEYVFRVTAVNAEGESEPLESKDVAKPKQPIGMYSLKIIEPAHAKTNNQTCVTSKDSALSAHLHSLIRVFPNRLCLLHPPGIQRGINKTFAILDGCTG